MDLHNLDGKIFVVINENSIKEVKGYINQNLIPVYII